MPIAQFLVSDAVRARLPAETRESAVRDMVTALAEAGKFHPDELDDIVRAVLRREQLGTTGIGHGIAIPHTRHTSVTSLVATCATLKSGVSFDAVDDKPVDVLFLLISPQDRPREHLQALESVVQAVGDAGFVQMLRDAGADSELAKLLVDGPRTETAS